MKRIPSRIPTQSVSFYLSGRIYFMKQLLSRIPTQLASFYLSGRRNLMKQTFSRILTQLASFYLSGRKDCMKRVLSCTMAVLLTLSPLHVRQVPAETAVPGIKQDKIPLCTGEVPAETAAPDTALDENSLHARSAVLMDADTGRVLFGKDAEHPMPMASTTKIMTCILTLENAALDDTVSVSAYAAKMPDVQLNIEKGEYYKLEDLLYSLMLESHNDSAAAIAEHVGGSVEGFARMMNEKAASIGCADTYFITPNGLDASETSSQPDGTSVTKVHSTTASDLAKILSYCIKQSPKKDDFLTITRAASRSFQNLEKSEDGTFTPGARSFSCNNHNAFLHMMDGALTGKTGFTGNAGYCYVGALERDGRTFVIALLACGWPNNKTYKWQDARKLFQYGIDHYKIKDITDYAYAPKPIPVENGAGTDRLLKTKMQEKPLVKQEAVCMLLSDKDIVEVRENLPKLLQAPIKKGSMLGSLDYYVNGQLAAQTPVYAAESIAERTLDWYLRFVLKRYFYPYLDTN